MVRALPEGFGRAGARWRRRSTWVLAALVAGSLVLKLALLAPIAHKRGGGDEPSYTLLAQRIASGLGMPGSTRPPLYPYAMGLGIAVAPEDTPPRVAMSLVQILASCVAMLLLYRLARQLFDRRTGLVAAAIFGFYPTLVAHTHLLWSETLTLPFLIAALLVLLRAAARGQPMTALAGGMLLGLMALVREFTWWFVPIAAVWLAARPRESRVRVRLAAAVVGGALLVVLPWTVRNATLHGSFVLISTNTWTPLLLANNDVLTGQQTQPWWLYQNFPGNEIERERYARRHALRFIWERQPGWLFERLRASVPELLSVDSFPLRHLRWGVYGDVPPPLRVAVTGLTLASYLALLLITSLGVTATRWTHGRLLPLLFILYAGAVAMPFPVVVRYRLPIVCAAIPFAAAWLARAEGIAWRSGARLAAGCALGLGLVALAFLEAGSTVLLMLRGD